MPFVVSQGLVTPRYRSEDGSHPKAQFGLKTSGGKKNMLPFMEGCPSTLNSVADSLLLVAVVCRDTPKNVHVINLFDFNTIYQQAFALKFSSTVLVTHPGALAFAWPLAHTLGVAEGEPKLIQGLD